MLVLMRTLASKLALVLALAPSIGIAQPHTHHSPLRVSNGLFDDSRPETLGLETLPDAQTITVFRPDEHDNTFNHGAVVTEFKGKLFVQWQTSRKDEDSPDTHVVYSTSSDGENWSVPEMLVESRSGTMTTGGGWWTHGDQLVAYINVWPKAGDIGQGGHTMFVATNDGESWSKPSPVTDIAGQLVRGIFEQDPRALPDGRIISAFHLQPGLVVAPFYTDYSSGTSGWTRGQMENLPHQGEVSREIEPSWFKRPDGAIVMIFRDQAESFRKLASVSYDRGETWARPIVTNVPDARTKQSAGNLPDGTVFMVGNPVKSRSRYPLAIMLSEDGKLFDTAWLLRRGGSALPPLRYPGQYKRPGYSYPKSVVIGRWLYVAYATNKEDIEVTRIPLADLCGCQIQ